MRSVPPQNAQETAIQLADEIVQGQTEHWATCVAYAARALLSIALYVVATSPTDIIPHITLGSVRERIVVRCTLLSTHNADKPEDPPIELPESLAGRFWALHVLPFESVVATAGRKAVQLLADIERREGVD